MILAWCELSYCILLAAQDCGKIPVHEPLARMSDADTNKTFFLTFAHAQHPLAQTHRGGRSLRPDLRSRSPS